MAFHDFRSERGSTRYGTEWDASVGFKISNIGLLVKYAIYDAYRFGVDKEILWLQAEVAF